MLNGMWLRFVNRLASRATPRNCRQRKLRHGTGQIGDRPDLFEIRLLPSPQVLSLDRTTPSGASTNATSVTYTVRFDQTVTGVDPTDFALVASGTVGTTQRQVAPVSGTSGAQYTITVSGITGSGTLGVNLVDDNSIQDGSSNPLGGAAAGDGNFTGQVYTIDQVSPHVVSINRTTPSSSPTNAATLTYTATFSESVTGVDASDFHVVTTGGTTADNTVGVSGSGATYLVTVTGIRGNGTVGINLVDDNSIRDLTGSPLVTPNAPAAFAPAQNFALGDRNTAGLLADLNGDGHSDLIVNRYDTDMVSVLLGNGDGTFAASQNFETGDGPVNFALADLNGDGRLDLAVANYLGFNVSVLLGNGNGTFADAQNFSVGDESISVAIGDVNGDGRPDLAVNVPTSAVVLLGNGDGTFGDHQNFNTGGGAYSLVMADLNGDGRLDLAVANRYDNNVSVLPGNGDGTFLAAQNFDAGNTPRSVAARDVNGDGKTDLAVVDYFGNSVSVLLGNGNGTFANPQNFATRTHPISLVIADLNGDGQPDLAVASRGYKTTSVLLGNGNGTFAAAQNFNVRYPQYAVATGDVNGDGRPDLVANVTYMSHGAVLLASGNGNFTGQVTTIDQVSPHVVSLNRTSPASSPTPAAGLTYSVTFSESVSGVDASDFRVATSGGVTADSTVGVSGSGTTYTLTVTGISGSGTVGVNLVDDNSIRDLAGNPLVTPNAAATFAPAQNFATALGPYSANIVDVNGDGRPDLVAANFASHSVSVLLGNGNGTFQGQSSFDVGTYPFSVKAIDLNGDGQPDLVAANYQNNNVSVLLGNGNGTFQGQATFDTGTNPLFVTVADLNHDNRPDLIASNLHGNSVSVLLGNGDGTFQEQATFATGQEPLSVAVIDLNGDGRLDLAVTNRGDDTIGVLLGNGNGTFQNQATFATGDVPISVTAGRINGDGIPDLIVCNAASNTVGVLLGNGNGTFQLQSTLTTGAGPQFVVQDDVNGDSLPDLLVCNSGSNTASVLLGNGNGTFYAQAVFPVGVQPTSVADTDLNGDGRPDLVITNESSHTISVLLSNANGSFNGQATSIDQTAPTASVTTPAPTINVAAAGTNTTTITITYADAGAGVDTSTFDASNIAVDNGATVTLSSTSGNVVTYTITAPSSTWGDSPQGTYTVSLAGTVQDLVGNPIAVDSSFSTFVVDTVSPYAVSLNRTTPASSPTNANSLTYTAMFSESVTGVDAGDFRVVTTGGASANSTVGVSGSGTTYTVTITGISGSGTVGVNLADDASIHDSAENPLITPGHENGDFTGQVTTIDQLSPHVVSLNRTSPAGSPTNAVNLTYTATFSESVTGVDAGDFQVDVAGGTSADATVGVSGSGTTYTVTVTGISGNGTVGVTLVDDNSIHDLAGNPLVTPNAPATFAPAQNFVVGNALRAVQMADLNGDGRPDLVVSSYGQNNVGVLLGNGNGTFSGAQNFNTGNAPWNIAIVDVNGDGRLDLAVTNFLANTVSVLLGNGNGTFADAQDFNAGNEGRSVAFGDVNGDGRPDLAVNKDGQHAVTVLLGHGDGTFGNGQNVTTGSSPYSVVMADLNGDGRLDLAVANRDDNNVSVLLGNGDGTFLAAQNFDAGNAPVFLAAGDVNGDGKRDLAVADFDGNSVSVLLGNGNGTFASPQNFATPTHPFAVVIADLNGDGQPDLAVTNRGYKAASVLLGNGNGTFAAAQNFNVGFQSFVTVGDVNGDGRPDLAAADYSENQVAVLLSNGNGNFTGQVTTIDHTAPTASVTTDAPTINVAAAGTNTTTIQVTYADVGGGVDAGTFGTSNITVDNEATVTDSSASGNVVTYTITAPASTWGDSPQGTYTVSLAGTVQDRAGNPIAAVPNFSTFTVDTVSPYVVSLNRTTPASSPTNATNLTYTATFSESVTGVDPSDFQVAVAGGTSADSTVSVSGSGTTYTVTVSGVSGSGTVGVNLVDDASIQDAAQNPLVTPGHENGDFTGQTTTIDNTAPTGVWGSVASRTHTAINSVSITFSEAVQNVSLDDFTLNDTDVSTLSGHGTVTLSNIGNMYTIGGLAGYDATGNPNTLYTVAVAGTNNIQDLVGNALSGLPSVAWTMDTISPTLSSINRSSPSGATTNASSVTFLATFSEQVSGVTASNFSLTGSGTIGTPATSNGGLTWSVAVTGLGSVNGTRELDLANSTGIADAASNALTTSTLSGQAYTLDHIAPTLSSINRSSPVGATTNASSVTFLATFSEQVSGVTASNFSLTGSGSIGTPATSNGGLTWSIAVTGLGSVNGTRELDLANNTGIVDAASNALSTSTLSGQSYTLDHVAPTLSSINRSSPVGATTNASSVTFLATFSEQVSGVTASNFSLTGSGSIGTPATSNGGLTWSIAVTGLGSVNGTRELDLANSTGIVDAANNALATSTLSGQAYTLDHVAPTLTSINRSSPSGATTNASSVTFLATFSEQVSGVTAGNFSLTGSGTIGTPSTGDGGLTWSIAVTGLAAVNGTRELDLANGTGIVDAANNSLSTSTLSGQSYTLDHTVPTLTGIFRSNPSDQLTNAASVTFFVTFSEAVGGVDSNLAADFALVGPASSGASFGTPTTSNGGQSWSIPVTGISTANGTLQLNQTHNTGLADAAGNAVSTSTFTGQGYTLDHVAPTLTGIFRSSDQVTNAASVTFLVKFSEAVSGVDSHVATDFALVGAGASGASFGTPTTNNSGLSWSIPVTGISTANGTLQLNQTHNTGLADLAGNAVSTATFTGQAYALDHTLPVLVSINRASPNGQYTTATSVTFLGTFSEKVTGVDANVSTNFALTGTAISGGVIGTPTTSDGGLTWSMPVTGLSSTANGTVQVHQVNHVGIQDAATNVLSGTFTSQAYTLDHVAPTLTGIFRSAPSGTLTNAASVTFLVKFSEAVSGMDTHVAADFALVGAGAAGASFGTPTTNNSGLSWSIPVTGISAANGTLQLNQTHNTGLADLAGNAVSTSTFTGQAYTLDHTLPVLVSINRAAPAGQYTTATSLTFLATFSEKVTGVDANVSTNFALTGTAISGGVIGAPTTTDGGLTWSIPVTGLSGTANGTVQVHQVNHVGIEDAATNALSGTFTSQAYTLDHVAPTLIGSFRSVPSGQVTNAASVTFLVKFSEAVNGVNANLSTDFALVGAGASVASFGTPITNNNGLSWSIPVTGISTANGTLQLNQTHNTGLADLAGNAVSTTTFTGQAYTLDHTVPTIVSFNRFSPSTATTGQTSVTFQLKFSEKVSGVDANVSTNFALTGTASAGGVIGTPVTSDGGLTWTIAVTGLSSTANGTVQIHQVNHVGIQDAAGNVLAGTWTSQAFTLQHTNQQSQQQINHASLLSANLLDDYWAEVAAGLRS